MILLYEVERTCGPTVSIHECNIDGIECPNSTYDPFAHLVAYGWTLPRVHLTSINSLGKSASQYRVWGKLALFNPRIAHQHHTTLLPHTFDRGEEMAWVGRGRARDG